MGKIKDLIRFFQFSGVYNNTLVSTIVKRFANKLNNFYGMDPKSAALAANSLITPVMQELVKQSQSGKANEFSLGDFLSKLNGNRTDLNVLVNQMMVA